MVEIVKADSELAAVEVMIVKARRKQAAAVSIMYFRCSVTSWACQFAVIKMRSGFQILKVRSLIFMSRMLIFMTESDSEGSFL